MNKLMAVAALGVAMLVGCHNNGHDHDSAGEPKKMSVESKSGSCPVACDKDKAK